MQKDAPRQSGTSAHHAGERAGDSVARLLEQKISAGDFADGSYLPAERELVEMFGVSRTVVREAIARLASQGLLDSRPRYRPVVRRPGFEAALAAADGVVGWLLQDAGGIKNLFDSRIFLEMSLVRHAALHARREDIEHLTAAIAANEAAIDRLEEFYDTDVAFHRVLYEIPRNPIFPAVHKAYVEWLSPHWRKMPIVPGRNRANFLRHQEIHDAIVKRDPEMAEHALKAHLDSAWEFVRGGLLAPLPRNNTAGGSKDAPGGV
jgi:DNA-binding FadR family transcriptional regulator